MEAARPLREVFADLTGTGNVADDAREILSSNGHAALPDELLAEAVVNYADTAPAEVAEHLSPFVAAHSVVGVDEAPQGELGWLDLLVTAPTGDEAYDVDDRTPDAEELGAEGPDAEEADDLGSDPGLDLDFGIGAETVPAVDAGSDAARGESDGGYADMADGPIAQTDDISLDAAEDLDAMEDLDAGDGLDATDNLDAAVDPSAQGFDEDEPDAGPLA
jgi:hypothetical protein